MIFKALFFSLFLTLVIEVPIAYFKKIPLKVAFTANLLTNPIVVVLFYWAKHFRIMIIPIVILLEIFAIIVEGYLYKGYHKSPWKFSLYVNAVSFSIGFLLQNIMTIT